MENLAGLRSERVHFGRTSPDIEARDQGPERVEVFGRPRISSFGRPSRRPGPPLIGAHRNPPEFTGVHRNWAARPVQGHRKSKYFSFLRSLAKENIFFVSVYRFFLVFVHFLCFPMIFVFFLIF